MNLALLIIGACNILIVLVIVGLSIPLLRRKIEMNQWYGVRIAKSFSSRENWYRINEYGARSMILWSIPILLIGIVTVVLSMTETGKSVSTAWTIALSFSPILILGSLVQILLWSRKLP